MVWGLHETVPVCLATDKIRPATPAEALAYLYLHGHRTKDDFQVCPDEEQIKYVNEVGRSSQDAEPAAPPQVPDAIEEVPLFAEGAPDDDVERPEQINTPSDLPRSDQRGWIDEGGGRWRKRPPEAPKEEQGDETMGVSATQSATG